jgi:hypothetical protein
MTRVTHTGILVSPTLTRASIDVFPPVLIGGVIGSPHVIRLRRSFCSQGAGQSEAWDLTLGLNHCQVIRMALSHKNPYRQLGTVSFTALRIAPTALISGLVGYPHSTRDNEAQTCYSFLKW